MTNTWTLPCKLAGIQELTSCLLPNIYLHLAVCHDKAKIMVCISVKWSYPILNTHSHTIQGIWQPSHSINLSPSLSGTTYRIGWLSAHSNLYCSILQRKSENTLAHLHFLKLHGDIDISSFNHDCFSMWSYQNYASLLHRSDSLPYSAINAWKSPDTMAPSCI